MLWGVFSVVRVALADGHAIPGQASPPPRRQYLHGVQGLRTVAALMVAVYHIWFHRVSGGVDVFFVVAGYFAAGSLLRIASLPTAAERLAGVGQYLLRTARRVIPSAVVVVVATAVAGLLFMPRSQWQTSIPHGWASLMFWENWYLIETGNDYLQQGLAASPFQQFWALSIQVQSYVVFPVLALAATAFARLLHGSPRRVFFAAAVGVLFISLAYSVYLTSVDQPTAYFHLGARLWEFAAGAVLALILRKPVGSKALMRLIGWVGLLGIVSFAAFVDPSQLLPGFLALIPVTAGAAVIAAARHGVEPSILKAKPLLWFADSSFAFYLWHWPILVLYRFQWQESVSLKGGLAILLLSGVLAVMTTSLIETPFRGSRRLRDSTMSSVAACLAFLLPAVAALTIWGISDHLRRTADWQAVEAVLAGNLPADDQIVPSAVVARQDRSEAYGRDCQQGTKPPEVKSCVWGDESSDTTITLVGASHDTQWTDLLAATADELGVRLVTITKGSCPFGDMSQADFEVHPSCPPWGEAVLVQLMKDEPDLVVTMATRSANGLEQVPSWKISYLERLAEAGIPVLGLRDNPNFGFDVPVCVERNGPDACAVQRAHVLVPLEELNVPKLPNFTFLDTADDYCGDSICPAVRDGVLVSWDGGHLTRTWTMVNGGRVHDAVEQILERR